MANTFISRVIPAKGCSIANPGVLCAPAAMWHTMMLMNLGDYVISASSRLSSPGIRCLCSRQARKASVSTRDRVLLWMDVIRTIRAQKYTNCIMNPEGAPGVKITSGQRKQRWHFRMNDHGGTNG